MKKHKSRPLITIDYTNWRGERALRHVRPVTLMFGHSPYYADKQWILQAFDDEKGEMRDFAMAKIHATSHPLFDVLARA